MLNPSIRPQTPVIVQGLTGHQGRRHAALMRAYGTNLVAGVSSNAEQTEVDGLPVFKSCAEAVAATAAEAAINLVRPEFAADAVLEAAESGLGVIVSVAEGVPVHDTMRVLRRIRELGTVWIGSSTPGMAIPAARIKLGFLPDIALMPGPVGILSKSGTLSYEVGCRMVRHGIGQSVWIGVGGDAVKGSRFADYVPFFAQDAETEALVVIGEIGGTEEEELAEALWQHGFAKPVLALIAGSSAPEGTTMGHAGALIHGDSGTVASKRQALEAAGGTVYNSIDGLVEALREVVRGQGAG